MNNLLCSRKLQKRECSAVSMVLLTSLKNRRILSVSGQPRRHLLTTGWSVFVSSKRLVAGDAFIFLRQVAFVLFGVGAVPSKFGKYFDVLVSRGENGELRVGVRRLMRQLSNMPSSVISSHSMHLGVLATASHAVSTGTIFSVFYKPRWLFLACILITWYNVVRIFLPCLVGLQFLSCVTFFLCICAFCKW